jgi:two-component system OmpR family response regulator
MKILVIEDQKESANYLVKGLTDNGMVVDWEEDGEKGFWRACYTRYDVILCDFHLPNKNGQKILEDLREKKNETPFIMVTVEREVEEKIKSLDIGADDYITKPFPIGELLARIRAVLRRKMGKSPEKKLILKDISLDLENYKAEYKNKKLSLRRKEFDLLYCFMLNPGRVLPRTLLLEKVWDMNADPFTNTVDVHVQSLRRKLKDKKGKVIRTIYGRGYEFLLKKDDRKSFFPEN